jgi:hypothetical protein
MPNKEEKKMKKFTDRAMLVFIILMVLTLIFGVIIAQSASAVVFDNAAYWAFNETAGVWAEELVHPNVYNLSLGTQGIAWENGKIGKALSPSGHVLNFTGLKLGSNNYSFNFWMYRTGVLVGGSEIIWGGGTGADGQFYWRTTGNADSGLYPQIKDSVGSKEFFQYPQTRLNQWDMVTLTVSPTNMTLYLNGSAVLSVALTALGINTNNIALFGGVGGWENLTNAYVDEFGIWNRTLSDTDVADLYNNGTGLTYSGGAGPSVNNITLTYPNDAAVFSVTGINFTAVYNFETWNVTNATISIYNSSGIFNSTFTDASALSNSSNWNISNFAIGNYKWNVYACGFLGLLNCTTSTNRTFSVGAMLSSISYPHYTYETENSTFTASFNVITGSSISLAQLVYNGTNYTISSITLIGSNLTISRTIDLPLNSNPFLNTTRNFFFRFTYAGSSVQETSVYTQNVSFINLQLCNVTWTNIAINFSFRDEFTNALINAATNKTDLQDTFYYWTGYGSVYKNYSSTNLSSSSNRYKFCIFPYLIYANANMLYEADDYSAREYYLRNATLTNATSEIPLVLLLTDYSIKFFVTLKDGLSAFPNAIVTISKYFTGEGIYRTIGIRKSDADGKFIEYFDIDKEYKFSVSRDGVSYGTINKWITCQAAPCTLILQIETAASDTWSGYYNVFATNVAYSLTYNDVTKMVTFTFNDLTGLANYFRLLVTKTEYNQSAGTICENYLYATSGTLYCNMTGNEGQFTAYAYISRSPDKYIDYIKFAIQTIKDTLGMTGILIAFFLIVTVALAGVWNPAVGVVMTAFAVGMMSILGFAAFSFATVTVIMIIALILIIKMRS